MAWAWLILAGLLEVAWSQSIRPTENFTRPLATLLCLALAAATVYPTHPGHAHHPRRHRLRRLHRHRRRTPHAADSD